MEFSQDKFDSNNPDYLLREGCPLALQITAACGRAIVFCESYEELTTQAYQDGFLYSDRTNFGIDADAMPKTETIRKEFYETTGRRTVLLNEVVKTTQDLISARQEIVLEYAVDPTAGRAGATPNDRLLSNLLPFSDSADTNKDDDVPVPSEDGRIVDPVMAEHIAYYTDDAQTALLLAEHRFDRANDWIARLESVRGVMDDIAATRLSYEDARIADIHIRIQKAVCLLAAEDFRFYDWLKDDLKVELQRRFDAGLLSYIVGSTEQVASQEEDNKITALLTSSGYDNEAL